MPDLIIASSPVRGLPEVCKPCASGRRNRLDSVARLKENALLHDLGAQDILGHHDPFDVGESIWCRPSFILSVTLPDQKVFSVATLAFCGHLFADFATRATMMKYPRLSLSIKWMLRACASLRGCVFARVLNIRVLPPPPRDGRAPCLHLAAWSYYATILRLSCAFVSLRRSDSILAHVARVSVLKYPA